MNVVHILFHFICISCAVSCIFKDLLHRVPRFVSSSFVSIRCDSSRLVLSCEKVVDQATNANKSGWVRGGRRGTPQLHQQRPHPTDCPVNSWNSFPVPTGYPALGSSLFPHIPQTDTRLALPNDDNNKNNNKNKPTRNTKELPVPSDSICGTELSAYITAINGMNIFKLPSRMEIPLIFFPYEWKKKVKMQYSAPMNRRKIRFWLMEVKRKKVQINISQCSNHTDSHI